MSTSATIRTAWDAAIWQHATVRGWTDKIYAYDILADSQFAVAKFAYQGKINFFTYEATRESALELSRQLTYQHQMVVTYYLQQTDMAESTYNTLVDRLETLDDLVISQLGSRWSNSVDFYNGAQLSGVKIVEIDAKRCWTSSYTYLATKSGLTS